jgi:hypothetical protein
LLYGGAAAGLAVAGAEQQRRSEPPYPTETLQRTAASVREVRNSTERDG